MQRKQILLSALSFFILPFLIGATCDRTPLFKNTITTQFSYPISIAVDTTRNRAYVVNSNNSLKYTSTTMSVLDLSNPALPVLLNNASNPFQIPEFSGQIYLDTAQQIAYVPNRYSTDIKATAHSLLKIDVNESGSFGHYDTFANGEAPFGITCCDTLGRIYVVSGGGNGVGSLDVYNPADLSTRVHLPLEITLKSSEDFQAKNSTEVAILGSQAFITNRNGRLFVINTDEVGDSTKQPIDSLVLNGGDFRGVATDGTLIYVVDARSDIRLLRILDPSLMPAISPDATNTTELDIATVQIATVPLGKNPNEIVVFKKMAYVTNEDDDTVSVIDVAAHTVTATITVGDQPFALAAFTSTFDSKDYLYVTNLAADSLSVIDLATNAVVDTFTP